jgi:HTH-type transcriptional regulator/antitoxin HigA
MRNLPPAESFPPGDFVREEMEARGWLPGDLAARARVSPRTVRAITTGKQAITAETALALGNAFGTSAEYWMNLESSYRLHLARARPAGSFKKRPIRRRRRSA